MAVVLFEVVAVVVDVVDVDDSVAASVVGGRAPVISVAEDVSSGIGVQASKAVAMLTTLPGAQRRARSE